MATFLKRSGRYTARVRYKGQHATETFGTLGAAQVWAREKEAAIDRGELGAPRARSGVLLTDLIDDFTTHRTAIRRPPGKTFANALARLKDQHGLEHLTALTETFWYRHALARIKKGAAGQTVASELTYAGSMLRHARREGHKVDADAPGRARIRLREQGIRVMSRERERRITDAEIAALLKWIDDNAERTHLPLRDLVEFALATAMRRGEILALKWTDIDGRVATIKRKHPRDPDRIEEVPLLKAHPAWPRSDPLDIINRQPKASVRVFPYVDDTVGFWFEKACEGAGLPDVVFHMLRHECLSRLAADRKFDVLRLAKVGGHRDLRNVRRYAKLNAADLADE